MGTALPSVGFIGLGIMGLPMAKHLCDAGYPVTVFNRSAERMEAAKAFGARTAASPRELAESADILITMLTDPVAIRAVLEGPTGAFAHPKKGLVWIQMSTIDIQSTQTFARQAEEHGMTFVDCPVTGSKKQVEAAELILLAGAEPEHLDYARPILSRLGNKIIHGGPVGNGTALKLCMNLIVGQMTTALAEAVTLAESTGVQPELIFQVLKASPALNCGYFTIKEQAFLKRDFSPAFSLNNLAKDLGFMVKEAALRNVKLPVTEAVQKLLEKARAEGLGPQDIAAVYLTLKEPAKKS